MILVPQRFYHVLRSLNILYSNFEKKYRNWYLLRIPAGKYKQFENSIVSATERFPIIQSNTKKIDSKVLGSDHKILKKHVITLIYTYICIFHKFWKLKRKKCAKSFQFTVLLHFVYRLRFYTQEIVLYRQDLINRFQRLSLFPNSGNEVGFDLLMWTILHQAHLSPLPISVTPIYWNYDYALRLYPLPHTVRWTKSENYSFITFSKAIQDMEIKYVSNIRLRDSTHWILAFLIERGNSSQSRDYKAVFRILCSLEHGMEWTGKVVVAYLC